MLRDNSNENNITEVQRQSYKYLLGKKKTSTTEIAENIEGLDKNSVSDLKKLVKELEDYSKVHVIVKDDTRALPKPLDKHLSNFEKNFYENLYWSIIDIEQPGNY